MEKKKPKVAIAISFMDLHLNPQHWINKKIAECHTLGFYFEIFQLEILVGRNKVHLMQSRCKHQVGPMWRSCIGALESDRYSTKRELQYISSFSDQLKKNTLAAFHSNKKNGLWCWFSKLTRIDDHYILFRPEKLFLTNNTVRNVSLTL